METARGVYERRRTCGAPAIATLLADNEVAERAVLEKAVVKGIGRHVV